MKSQGYIMQTSKSHSRPHINRNNIQHPSALPTGHERPMASLISHRDSVKLQLINGDCLFGRLTHFDKWSLTVELDGTDESTVIFKHALMYFRKYNKEIDYFDRLQGYAFFDGHEEGPA